MLTRHGERDGLARSVELAAELVGADPRPGHGPSDELVNRDQNLRHQRLVRERLEKQVQYGSRQSFILRLTVGRYRAATVGPPTVPRMRTSWSVDAAFSCPKRLW